MNDLDDEYFEDTFSVSPQDRFYYKTVMRIMSSLAFAGGIAGAGISSVSPDANASEGVNVRLANYGTISGGFRAVKPVATLQSAIDVNDKMAKSKKAY